eukprot:796790-Alexandrium_andersonii.AAC.1
MAGGTPSCPKKGGTRKASENVLSASARSKPAPRLLRPATRPHSLRPTDQATNPARSSNRIESNVGAHRPNINPHPAK